MSNVYHGLWNGEIHRRASSVVNYLTGPNPIRMGAPLRIITDFPITPPDPPPTFQPDFEDTFVDLSKGWVNNSALPAIGINTTDEELQWDSLQRTNQNDDNIAVDLRNVGNIGPNGVSDTFNLRFTLDYFVTLGTTGFGGIGITLCNLDETNGWNTAMKLVNLKLRGSNTNIRWFFGTNPGGGTGTIQNNGVQTNISGDVAPGSSATVFCEIKADGVNFTCTIFGNSDFTNPLFAPNNKPVAPVSGFMHFLKILNGANVNGADAINTGFIDNVVLWDGFATPPITVLETPALQLLARVEEGSIRSEMPIGIATGGVTDGIYGFLPTVKSNILASNGSNKAVTVCTQGTCLARVDGSTTPIEIGTKLMIADGTAAVLVPAFVGAWIIARALQATTEQTLIAVDVQREITH